MLRIYQRLLVACLALTFLFNLCFIFFYRYPVFILDEWQHLGFYMSNGLFGNLFCKYYGHPMIFPGFLYRLSLAAFDGSALSRISMNLTIIVVNILLFTKLLIQQQRNTPYVTLPKITLFLLSGIAFTLLVNHHKLLWGMAIHDHLTIMGLLIAANGFKFLLVEPNDPKALFFLFLGGVISSLSFGYGGAVWGALLISLLLLRASNILPYVIIILGIFFFVLTMLFTPNCGTGEISSLGLVNFDILHSIQFTFMEIGNLFSKIFYLPRRSAMPLSFAMGAIGSGALFGISLYAFRYRLHDIIYVMLIPAWFAFGASLMTSFARTLPEAVMNKYVTISLMFWISLFALITALLMKPKQNDRYAKYIPNTSLLITLALLILSLITFDQALRYVSTQVKLDERSLMIAATRTAEERQYVYGQENYRTLNTKKAYNFIKENSLDTFDYLWASQFNTLIQDNMINTASQCLGAQSQAVITGPFITFRGWVRHEKGYSLKTLYITKEKEIIGIGLKSPVSNRKGFEEQNVYAPWFERTMSGILPQSALLLFGWHSNFTSVIKITNLEQLNLLTFIGELDNGTFCQVNMTLKNE